MNEWMSLCSSPLVETYRERAVCPSYACLYSSVLSLLQKPVNVRLMSWTVSGNEFQIEAPEVAKLRDPYCANRLRGMLDRSSGNHDWLLVNASACVSCGFRLRNASDCVWMETGLKTSSWQHDRTQRSRNARRHTNKCTTTTTWSMNEQDSSSHVDKTR